jgi:ribonuclease H2 subunit A
MVSNAKPKLSREETKDHLNTLIYGSHNCLDGPILVSDIPPPAKAKKGVTVGIDEAGRGPVLGPMVYALAYWDDDASFALAGYNDSKQMSVEMRNRLFESTINETNIGFVVRVLHASEISGNMLRQDTYNLNTMSHDAAIEMIRCLLNSGVVISKCFIDTVGRESTYKNLLDTVFDGEGIEFVVEKKADANYIQCSAASICKLL